MWCRSDSSSLRHKTGAWHGFSSDGVENVGSGVAATLTCRARSCSIPAAEGSAVGRRGSSPRSTDAKNWHCFRSPMRRPGACSLRCRRKGAANAGGSYSAMVPQSRATEVGASCSLPRSNSPDRSDASFARSDCLRSSTCLTGSWLSIASVLAGSSPRVLRHGGIPNGSRTPLCAF